MMITAGINIVQSGSVPLERGGAGANPGAGNAGGGAHGPLTPAGGAHGPLAPGCGNGAFAIGD